MRCHVVRPTQYRELLRNGGKRHWQALEKYKYKSYLRIRLFRHNIDDFFATFANNVVLVVREVINDLFFTPARQFFRRNEIHFAGCNILQGK